MKDAYNILCANKSKPHISGRTVCVMIPFGKIILSAYKVHRIICTQERSGRTFTELNGGCLWRKEYDMLGEEGRLLAHAVPSC